MAKSVPACLLALLLATAGCSNQDGTPGPKDYVKTVESSLRDAGRVRRPKDRIEFLQRAYEVAEALRKKFPDDPAADEFLEKQADRLEKIPDEVKALAIRSRDLSALRWAVGRGSTIPADYDSLVSFWDKGPAWREFVVSVHPEVLPVYMELAARTRNRRFFDRYVKAFNKTGRKLADSQDQAAFNAQYRLFLSGLLADAARRGDRDRVRFLLEQIPAATEEPPPDETTLKQMEEVGKYLCDTLKDEALTTRFLQLGYTLPQATLDKRLDGFSKKFKEALLNRPEETALQTLRLGKWHGDLSKQALDFLIRLPAPVLAKVDATYLDDGIEYAVKHGYSDYAMQLIQAREKKRPLTPHEYERIFLWALKYEDNSIVSYAEDQKEQQNLFELDLDKLAGNKKLFVLYAPKILHRIYPEEDDTPRTDGTTVGRLRKLLNHHHPEVVFYVVKNYDLQPVWAQVPGGRTLLMDVCRGGNLEAARYLVEKKHADVNAETDYVELKTTLVGRTKAREGALTPLFFAAESGNVDLARYLIAKGASVNARSNFGATPLMYAVSAGQPEMVRFLIESGADVNAQMDSGLTPAELVGLGDYSEIATAVRRAKAIGNQKILQMLWEAGATH